MVTPSHCQADPSLPDVGKGRQGWENGSRDHSSICEPKLKEVAVYQEVITEVGYSLQKPVERCAGIAGIFAQMGI